MTAFGCFGGDLKSDNWLLLVFIQDGRHALGSLLIILGCRTESVPLLKSAVTILESRLTPAHPQLAVARENLRKALS